MRKRNRRINVRLSKDEYEYLNGLVEETQLSREEYLRVLINGVKAEKTIDEELTDFKFLYGDKVKYEGYICKVIKVLDELIEIEYDKEEAEMRKRPRTEWVDTSNKTLEIEDLV